MSLLGCLNMGQVMVRIYGALIWVINMCRVGEALFHSKAIILSIGILMSTGYVRIRPFHRCIVWIEWALPCSSEWVICGFSNGSILVVVSISWTSWAKTEVCAHKGIYWCLVFFVNLLNSWEKLVSLRIKASCIISVQISFYNFVTPIFNKLWSIVIWVDQKSSNNVIINSHCDNN